MAMEASVDAIFSVSQKVALTRASFLAYILPPEASFYLMAVLVQFKDTRFYRLALLPLLVWFAYRGIFVDLAGGDPMQAQSNTVLITRLCFVALRGTAWALAREPYRRYSVSNKQDKPDSESLCTALRNAWDLTLNMRGVGWNWGEGLVLPKPAFETNSRTVFVLLSAAQFAFYVMCFDGCRQIIRALSPDTFGSINGGSLFDHTLSPFLELSRAVFVAFLGLWMGYFAIQWIYQPLRIIGVVLFQQRPSQWPPLFDSPWRSTSLSDFWGRRWHQLLRQSLVIFGLRPLEYLFGRLAGVLGAFFLSGIIHDIELRSLGRGGNSAVVFRFWLMNGVGVVLERTWKKTTGKQVGGVLGGIWTFGWLAFWGVPMVDEWARVGRFGAESLPVEPSLALVGFVRRCLGRS